MPLRDLSRNQTWTSSRSFVAGWATTIMSGLNLRLLPPRYLALPAGHGSGSVRPDVGTFDQIHRVTWDHRDSPSSDPTGPDRGEVAVAHWVPSRATLTLTSDLRDPDQYEVQVYDTDSDRRLAAVVELVTFDNKERRDDPRAFVCRWVGGKGEEPSIVETWTHPMAVDRALPTLPLWVDEDLAFPLDLEESYEETCRNLRIR